MTSERGRRSIQEVMTVQVRTASPEEPLSDLSSRMVEARCHHMPIVEGGVCVGMISASDLFSVVRSESGGGAAAESLRARRADEVMSSPVQTIEAGESVDVAIDRIGPGDLHALVVVDEAGRLAGIVTHHDLLDYLMG